MMKVPAGDVLFWVAEQPQLTTHLASQGSIPKTPVEALTAADMNHVIGSQHPLR